MSESDELVKIRADIPDDEGGGGESFWAKPLGNSLYESQNIVRLVPGLHPLDVVRCHERPDELPEVVEVVRASGYKTIGVIFREDATQDQHIDAVWELMKKGITPEKAADLHFFFAVPPDVDYDWAVNFLKEQDEKGVLYFEEYG
jgi:hypothetical protein